MLLQDELGSALAGEDVTLARMNMHSNEIPPEYKSEFFVKEYPSLFFKVDSKLSIVNVLSTLHYTSMYCYMYQPADKEEPTVQFVGTRNFRTAVKFNC